MKTGRGSYKSITPDDSDYTRGFFLPRMVLIDTEGEVKIVRYHKQIVVVNYGMGNLGSVENALTTLEGNFIISNRSDDLERADALILPGVGAFGAAMENLTNLGLIEPLREQVLARRKPYLGICLGMQILAQDSLEQGFYPGLGWVNGHVVLLTPDDGSSVPHVGWNTVTLIKKQPLFARIDDHSHFYFDHSFHLQCDPSHVAATCDYGGGSIVAAIRKENIFATQFHPEKSQRNGMKLLRAFLDYVESGGSPC